MHFLNEGDVVHIKGSGKKPYEVKKAGGIVSCSCPAWRNIGGPIDVRVCKHIRASIDRACLLPQAHAMYDNKAAKPAKGAKTAENAPKPAAVKKDTAPPVLLAHSWVDEDPTGWWMSEKLDGVRAWWDGEKFLSRLGNEYHAPEWFKAEMPAFVLDGELFIGRGKFQETVSTVRKLVPNDEEWANVKFMVFDGGWWDGDSPEDCGPFEERLAYLKQEIEIHGAVAPGNEPILLICEQVKCKNVEHLRSHLKEVEAKGGEGVMLRKAGSLYEEGRSSTLLKVKTFKDDEAVVRKHIPGRGKHKGRLGALEVKWNGVTFKVGTGFSDDQRRNPPKIGSKVTFRYQELSKDGVPRFPVFVRIRTDCDF